MKVEELAELVHMSVSSFHEHFKSVFSMSPQDYQKVLRLQESRRLMLSTMMDASPASQRVGYLKLRSSAENTAASSAVRRPRTSPDCVKRLDPGLTQPGLWIEHVLWQPSSARFQRRTQPTKCAALYDLRCVRQSPRAFCSANTCRW
jgi:AraC-like DNA-binding protein